MIGLDYHWVYLSINQAYLFNPVPNLQLYLYQLHTPSSQDVIVPSPTVDPPKP